MSDKPKKLLIILFVLLVIGSCIASLVFGLPAAAKMIDDVIAAGPGSIAVAIIVAFLAYYCIPGIIVFVVFCLAIYISVKARY